MKNNIKFCIQLNNYKVHPQSDNDILQLLINFNINGVNIKSNIINNFLYIKKIGNTNKLICYDKHVNNREIITINYHNMCKIFMVDIIKINLGNSKWDYNWNLYLKYNNNSYLLFNNIFVKQNIKLYSLIEFLYIRKYLIHILLNIDYYWPQEVNGNILINV